MSTQQKHTEPDNGPDTAVPDTVDATSPEGCIITEEETLLADVHKQVANVDTGGEALMDYNRELIELRDQYAEAKPEDRGPLAEQMMRMQAIGARRGKGRDLPVDPNVPYFAHMRLRTDGPKGQHERDVMIGKRGFISSDSTVRIVDWRNAPVSRIYYRYEEGDDYDEEVAGVELEGVVLARRNVSIHKGVLRRIGCPQGTFVRGARKNWILAAGQAAPTLQGGQGKAARTKRKSATPVRGQMGVHGGLVPRADKHLPEIAALIDKEQFELITRPDSGLVLIQGGAGSGKTTVALHRVAYLNFAEPGRFRTNRMLYVVPNHALARYIEGVLPSLGVNGVPVVTYAAWASRMRRRLVRGFGGRYTENTLDTVARVKKHPALLRIFDDYLAAQEKQLADRLPEALRSLWDSHSDLPVLVRLRRVGGRLKEINLQGSDMVRAEALLRTLTIRGRDVVCDWQEVLTDAGLLRDGFARHGGEAVSDSELTATVNWVSMQSEETNDASVSGDPERIVAVDGRNLNEAQEQLAGRLDPEDDPLLLHLVQVKHGGLIEVKAGVRKDFRYAHIAIDEAQDMSAAQLEVLLDAVDSKNKNERCVTVAGDSAQRLVFDNAFTDWKALLRAAGHTAVEVNPLSISYRSTAEVMRLARDVLGPLAESAGVAGTPLIAREGAPVEVHEFQDMGESVGFLAEALRSLVAREPMASVALITRYPQQADGYHEALKRAEVPKLRRVRRQDFTFTAGIDVTDVAQVKGLEFDYVLILDATAANYPDTLEARHILHIALTRSVHQLWLVNTSAPSSLLPDWLAGSDENESDEEPSG